MGFKFNQLLRAILAGGGVAPVSLRYASTFNYRANATSASTATRRKMWTRVKVVIGSANFSSLKIRFQSSILAYGGEAAIGNDYYIEKCSFEKETGGAAYTPVTFSGGRTATVASGSGGLVSDSILPSAFGLGSFTRDHVYWIRVLVNVTTAGHVLPSGGVLGTGGVALWHDPVTTGVSDVDSTGGPVFGAGSGGTGPLDFDFKLSFCPILIGTPTVTTGKYISYFGDSIVAGEGDTAVAAGWAWGFAPRSLFNADFATNARSACNFGVAGTAAGDTWTGALTETKTILDYGNVAVEEWGTNGPVYANSAVVWSYLKGVGQYVIRTKLLTQTNSTDSWATTANQTKTANYTTPTGNRIVFNGDVAAQEGVLYDKFVSFDAAVLHTDRDLWKAPSYTTDGLHPAATGHEAIAAVMRTTYAAIP